MLHIGIILLTFKKPLCCLSEWKLELSEDLDNFVQPKLQKMARYQPAPSLNHIRTFYIMRASLLCIYYPGSSKTLRGHLDRSPFVRHGTQQCTRLVAVLSPPSGYFHNVWNQFHVSYNSPPFSIYLWATDTQG